MTCITNKNTENDFCTSRLTWTDLQIVQSVVHKVQQSCTVEKMSRERGFAEMMIAFYYYIFICRKKSRVFNG